MSSSVVGKFFLGLAGKWLSNKILKGKSKEATEIIKEVTPESKPLDIEHYRKIFSDPLFKKKFETLKQHIPELLAELAIKYPWVTIERVEQVLDFVADKTDKVILPDHNAETVKITTDLEKVHLAIWGINTNVKPLAEIDDRVKLDIIDFDLVKETALFDHNANKYWKEKSKLKQREKEVGKALAPWVLCAMLEYESDKWYAISFEAFNDKGWKNIGRVLRGGTTNNPVAKYAPKKDQLVGFWMQPAFDTEQGMSAITWIKLI